MHSFNPLRLILLQYKCMGILLDKVPTTVQIDDQTYVIQSDFRISIKFEVLMQQPIPDEEKIIQALNLYYSLLPNNLEEAIERMIYFYQAGQDLQNESLSEHRKSVSPIYSYEYDSDYIYAAFLDQYGIDLQDIEYLHWWKFRALFSALKPDNRIVEIMSYRAMEISPSMSREQRQFYQKMKKQYAIPLPQSEREKLSAVEEALLHGGDISKILDRDPTLN